MGYSTGICGVPSMCQVLLGSEYPMVRSEGEVRDTIKGYTSDINLERAERQRQMSKVN